MRCKSIGFFQIKVQLFYPNHPLISTFIIVYILRLASYHPILTTSERIEDWTSNIGITPELLKILILLEVENRGCL